MPAAIGIGVGLGAYVVLSLIYLPPAFVALVAVALVLASVELHEALKKQGMTSAIVPIVIGSVAISVGSYFAGRQEPVIFSTTSVLLASLALTVLASMSSGCSGCGGFRRAHLPRRGRMFATTTRR